MLADPASLRRVLGYLPQEFGAYPRTSPEVMLDHIAALKGIGGRGVRKALVEQLLVQTNLWDVRKKSIDSFSGGMRQRFGIAQALTYWRSSARHRRRANRGAGSSGTAALSQSPGENR